MLAPLTWEYQRHSPVTITVHVVLSPRNQCVHLLQQRLCLCHCTADDLGGWQDLMDQASDLAGHQGAMHDVAFHGCEPKPVARHGVAQAAHRMPD